MRIFVFALAMLSGCAQLPGREMRVVWHDVSSLPELNAICNTDNKPSDTLHGCFRERFGVCHIYTRSLGMWEAKGRANNVKDVSPYYHETAGHELRHCRDGAFHGSHGVTIHF